MLIAPSALPASFPAITQVARYTLDASSGALVVTSLVIDAPDSANGFFNPQATPGSTLPGDPTLAQPTGVQLLLPGAGASVQATPASLSLGTGLPALEYDNGFLPPAVEEDIAYVIPFSAAINPDGYTYQTLGTYVTIPGDGTLTEGYFSTGIPTLSALPASGQATYTGRLSASTINARQHDPGSADGSVNVVVDFSTMNVTITTSALTDLSNNAPPGTTPSPAPGLNFHGVLTYAPASNTFSGSVLADNGMTGNVTGRFYGAGISAATSSKTAGSSPEIGGTFALFAPGVEAMQGAFGAN